jgi:hypothetical protein
MPHPRAGRPARGSSVNHGPDMPFPGIADLQLLIPLGGHWQVRLLGDSASRIRQSAIVRLPEHWRLIRRVGGRACEVDDFSFNVVQVLRSYLVYARATALTLERKPQEFAYLIECET